VKVEFKFDKRANIGTVHKDGKNVGFYYQFENGEWFVKLDERNGKTLKSLEALRVWVIDKLR
jgi:hypothetical protein